MIETTTAIADYITDVLSKQVWHAQKEQYEQSISEIVEPYLQKKQEHYNDPILDFLFDYYAFRPSHLKRWSPGFGTLLQGAKKEAAPDISELSMVEEGAYLNLGYFPERRKDAAKWILSLLKKSLDREPSFGCFGMHEWAMVYKTNNLRHAQFPLRMEPEKLADFVESRPLVCTHFDAFRFFTEPAKPRNKHDLSRDTFAETEQPGCLHTNMDLYKWGFKMFPWISSVTIKDAFLLARDTRIIDMKASPYDLRERGLEPIKIETETGRLEYVEKQKEIYRCSVPVRKQLIGEYQNLIFHL